MNVTCYVKFTHCPDDEDSPSINGVAEIYGDRDNYDVVAIRVTNGEYTDSLTQGTPLFMKIRDELIHAQHVYDSVCEAQESYQ